MTGYVILITVKWTGSKSLYPILYETKDEATRALDKIPVTKTNNTMQICNVTEL